jgi:hypothetical protein
MMMAVSNERQSGKASPLPNNGGTVLHQVYNKDNPGAESWYPLFAPYTHPTEILRGYTLEAERINEREMTPSEVDTYWREQAMTYIHNNRWMVLRNVFRKSLEFTANTEVANNRSLADERMFSPLLKVLPSPFIWLFALGVPGLVLLVRKEQKAVLVLAPVLIVLATFAVFFAEARFRFHAVPLFALCAGVTINQYFCVGR